MKKSLRIGLLMMMGLFGIGGTAMGQTADHPNADLSVGYSVVAYDTGFHGRNAIHGVEVSGTAHVNRWFGLTGEASGHYQGGALHYLLGGPRFTYRGHGRVEPFTHALFGAALFDTTGRFAMAVGGGVDVKVNEKFAVRVIQADYAPVFSDGVVIHNARITSGVVFRF